jgi:hypothetical protein
MSHPVGTRWCGVGTLPRYPHRCPFFCISQRPARGTITANTVSRGTWRVALMPIPRPILCTARDAARAAADAMALGILSELKVKS